MARTVALHGTLATALLAYAMAFYLPGIAPVDYEEGAPVYVYANKVNSPTIKVPFGYYSIPACPPPGEQLKPKAKHRNLGQILSGERSDYTRFQINMRVDEQCKVLCERDMTLGDMQRLRQLINKDYRVHLNVDNMPLVVEGKTTSGQVVFQLGYPLGAVVNNATYLYNHLRLTIEYHRPEFSTTDFYLQSGSQTLFRVVGFKARPASQKACVEKDEDRALVKLDPGKVKFTYDVTFVESPIKWATRWDSLLTPSPEQKQVQWFSIMNSIMVTVFLSGIVALVLLRTVHQDFMRYNQLEDEDEIQDESGWKLVHGDVFRPPRNAAVFCVLNGAGAQVFWMTLVTIVFAVAGFLSPANRGGFISAALFTWVFTGVIGGYVSSSLYGTFGGENKRAVSLGSIAAFPGISFAIFFVLNFLLWMNGGSNAVPFLTLVLLLFLWFGLSAPLTLVGSFLGYRSKPFEYPCRTNNIPREVPPPPFGIRPFMYCFVTGLMPFGVVFIELVFILSSLWQNQIFYMFGFLFLVFLLMIVTCMEVSVVFTYMKLSTEDYRWWWHSFLYTAASGSYVLAYSIFFLITQTEVNIVTNFVTTFLYIGYMGLISMGFALMTGYLGFWSSFWFVRKIYSRIRID